MSVPPFDAEALLSEAGFRTAEPFFQALFREPVGDARDAQTDGPRRDGRQEARRRWWLLLLRRPTRSNLTVHGFRSAFRPREVAEVALAHTVEDKVEAAHRRSDLFDKRRALMAAFCGSSVQSTETVAAQ